MKIRVPAGVVVDRQAWGGRFVSREQLVNLAAATDTVGLRAIERLAAREYDRAAAKHQRAADRYQDDPKRFRERRALAQQQQQEWERVYAAAQDFQETTPAPKPRREKRRGRPVGKTGRSVPTGKPGQVKRPGQTVRPGKTRQVRPAVKKRRAEPKAVEWEIGFKYRSTRRNKRSSDVDINLRIRRVDGRPFDVRQARKVLETVRRTQETPDAYLVAGVDWKRPYAGTGWRHGDVGDMENFWATMYARDRDPSAWDVKAQDFRFGAIKDMENDDDDDGE